ncbi:MAG: glutaredoxin domain-containing protein [Allomuricauda sp.]
MKCTLSILLAFLAFQFMVAQSSEVDIVAHNDDKGIVFYAVNKSGTRQKVNLTVMATNLSGNHGPIVKMVAAKDSVEMTTLLFMENNSWSYDTSYTYIPKPTEKEIEQQKLQLKQELFDFLDTKNNPIIVFYGEGCTRSAYAKELLDKKKIPYKYLNLTRHEHFNKAMQELLLIQEPEIKRVGYPIFLVDGRLDHDIENLRLYIKELASNTDFRE